MNPFAERSSKHNTWPVILTIYNLPPWLMQKRKYLLLTILISRPVQRGVDIDIFLEPLMEEMKMLWKKVLKCWTSTAKRFVYAESNYFCYNQQLPCSLHIIRIIQGKG